MRVITTLPVLSHPPRVVDVQEPTRPTIPHLNVADIDPQTQIRVLDVSDRSASVSGTPKYITVADLVILVSRAVR